MFGESADPSRSLLRGLVAWGSRWVEALLGKSLVDIVDALIYKGKT